MISYIFRPLTTWPGEMHRIRKHATFRSSWTETLKLLSYELGRLRATNVILQAAVGEADIRIDGMLRAHATPTHPGIIVAFDSMHGPLRYPCDAFVDWQDNVRAIALSLEALRQVDRYGVTKRSEQYAGFKALPAPSSDANSDLATRDDAADWLIKFLRDHNAGPPDRKRLLSISEVAEQAYRRAAKVAHPDSPTGSNATFTRLTRAYELLAGGNHAR